jgi:hypothetical protein
VYQLNRNPFVDHPEWVREIYWPRLEISLLAIGIGGRPIHDIKWPAEFTNAVLQISVAFPPVWSDSGSGVQASDGMLHYNAALLSRFAYYRLRLW